MKPIFVKECLLNFPVFDGQPIFGLAIEFTAHIRFSKATGLGHSELFTIDHKPLPLKVRLTEEQCRFVGDAVFAFFCPDDAAILTTNVKDHKPLAEAIGKDVDWPS